MSVSDITPSPLGFLQNSFPVAFTVSSSPNHQDAEGRRGRGIRGWGAIAGGSGTCAATRRVMASTKGDDFGAQLGLARGARAGAAKLECFEELDIKPCQSETQFRERGLCVAARLEEFCR